MQQSNSTQGKVPAITLYEHADYSYVPRTTENAEGAAITVASAVDYSTGGERLTRRVAGEKRYVKVPYGLSPETAAQRIVAKLKETEGDSINIAGNGIYTFAEHGIEQAAINRWLVEVLALVVAEVPLSFIRSGGQTGMDQAGLVASLVLGVPAVGLYPSGYRRRLANGTDGRTDKAKLEAELLEQAASLREPALPACPGVAVGVGESGLGAALDPHSEIARTEGRIKHGYPVKVLDTSYPDAAAAYAAFGEPADAAKADTLMVSLIRLKLQQNDKLTRIMTRNGGAGWLASCCYRARGADSLSADWAGQGTASRYIRNLIAGYEQALLGEGELLQPAPQAALF